MLVRCVQPFGNFQPGDELVLPEGAVFDHYYFELVPQDAPADNPPESEESK